MNAKYKAEFEDAKGNETLIAQIRKAYIAERAGLLRRQDAERRRQAEQTEKEATEAMYERAAEEADLRAALNARAQREIEELQIRTAKKGRDAELALLALRRKRAVEAARAAGADVKLVEQEFDLRRRMVDLTAESIAKLGAAGTFRQTGLLGRRAGPDSKIAQHTKETAEQLAKLRVEIRNRRPTWL